MKRLHRPNTEERFPRAHEFVELANLNLQHVGNSSSRMVLIASISMMFHEWADYLNLMDFAGRDATPAILHSVGLVSSPTIDVMPVSAS